MISRAIQKKSGSADAAPALKPIFPFGLSSAEQHAHSIGPNVNSFRILD